jgi:diguanylate cyclase (GGDEF)-like protein
VEYSKEEKNNLSLKEKDLRYSSLANVLDKINLTLEIESVTETLAQEAFSLISKNRGVCILYLIDSQTQKLKLFKSKAEKEGLVIKAKEGDILDLWVLRHAVSLLIEDIRNDFRFDPDKLTLLEIRPVSSLASAPFLIENKQLGILRLDNQDPGFYSQDDLRFLVAISDLGAIAIENSELFKGTQDLAIHDSLTGLYTKSYFLECFKEEYKRSIRQSTPLSLLMLDIDLFKKYNDQFGHTAGDIVLQKLSRAITEPLIRLNPVTSRFGGEEFCIAIAGVGKKEALEIAESLRSRVEREKVILRRSETNITVSIGVANLPEDTMDEEELIRKADKAMYRAKKKGRNRVCC